MKSINHLRRIAAVSTLAIACAMPAAAQDTRVVGMPSGFQFMATYMQPETTYARFMEQLRYEFGQLDADANGKLDSEDAEIHDLMNTQRTRSNSASQYMSYDLDGDAAISEDEVRLAITYNARNALGPAGNGYNNRRNEVLQATTQIAKVVRDIQTYDANGDGKLSYTEMLVKWNFQDQSRQRNNGEEQNRIEDALALDIAKGGELPFAAYQSAGEALFRLVDTNKDDKLGQEELVAYWQTSAAPNSAMQAAAVDTVLARARAAAAASQNQQRIAETAGCAMPAPTAQAQVVVVGMAGAQALSSVTIASQDNVVYAGEVKIEPGAGQIYLVMNAYYATIWKFTGAVDRLERVVLSGHMTREQGSYPDQPGLVGVSGVPKEKVTFLAKSKCIKPFYEVPSRDATEALQFLRTALGREPDKVIPAGGHITGIPSGAATVINDPDANKLTIVGGKGAKLGLEGDMSDVILRPNGIPLDEEVRNKFPGGRIDFDPRNVIASRPVASYEVLPVEAGLLQLVRSGALKLNRSGEFIVQKQTRLPSGLGGSYKFIVPRGVPVPEGIVYGLTCVVVEDPNAFSRLQPCRNN